MGLMDLCVRTGWICGLCTYVNAFDFPSCAMCTAEQPADPDIGVHYPDPSVQPMPSSAPSTRDFWVEETQPYASFLAFCFAFVLSELWVDLVVCVARAARMRCVVQTGSSS
jgi:hypothetical protein